MAGVLAGLAERVRGEVRFGEPLAGYTTYRIGGPAAALVRPRDADDVVAALAFARDAERPWMALGLGSNVLVRDAGFPGLVLVIGRNLAEAEADWQGQEGVWRVGAGLPTPLLARRTAEAGVGGVHRLVGVPGTVGGGVYMNAGAHGQEFRDVVREVDLVTADGEVTSRPGGDVSWEYRASNLGDVVVLSATVALSPADPTRLQAEIREHFRWRKEGTPFNEPCCGSVFRNPGAPGPASGSGGGEGGRALRTAGQLIDAAGMKGFRIGGAEVSRMHANYIVNTGGATADDVLRVIEAVRARVEERFGVVLQREVKIVG